MPGKRGFPDEYHFRSVEEGGIWDWGVFKNSHGDAGIGSQLQKVDNLGDENYLPTLNCNYL